MNENEHSRVEVDCRPVSAEKPAKRNSRALYAIKIGLVAAVLLASAYVVETKAILTLLSAPTLGVPS
jgi:hypothetical protein